nr:hypothetical protein Clen_124 [Cedratvirus lena]
MFDTLLIVFVFVLSYFSLIRRSKKDRQTLLLDRLERYLDRVAPETEEEEPADVEEEDGEEVSQEEEEEGDEEKEEEDPLTLLSKTFLDATGNSKDTEKLVQASRELLKENLGAFMNQENQKEFAKIFGQLSEFVRL